MSESAEAPERTGPTKAGLLAALLEVGGFLVAAAALVWAINAFWLVSRQPQPAVSDFLRTVALLLAGWGGGLLLWGVAEIVRKLDALPQALEPLTPPARSPGGWAGGAPPPPTGDGSPANSPALGELVGLLRELRDISLLNEQQRALRLEAQGRAVARRLEREVPALLREHNWFEARRRVQEARERFPAFSEWDALETQIERLRAEVEARDLEAITRQVNDLAGLGAWTRAMEIVNDLLERHPSSAPAAELAKRVRFEREKAEAEQRARLMAQAQAATSRREWSAALQAANAIMQRFPNSPEALALQPQLPTLRENVEIETRRRMESEIRELIKQHRYDQAVRLAHELVEQYPHSPQAAALRDQLPRLEQRAAAMH